MWVHEEARQAPGQHEHSVLVLRCGLGSGGSRGHEAFCELADLPHGLRAGAACGRLRRVPGACRRGRARSDARACNARGRRLCGGGVAQRASAWAHQSRPGDGVHCGNADRTAVRVLEKACQALRRRGHCVRVVRCRDRPSGARGAQEVLQLAHIPPGLRSREARRRLRHLP
eukprot:Amastigsp_a676875_118.p3 type:complete len:172 gc:universal Amastigsp_a676875_118:447-962(+)